MADEGRVIRRIYCLTFRLSYEPCRKLAYKYRTPYLVPFQQWSNIEITKFLVTPLTLSRFTASFRLVLLIRIKIFHLFLQFTSLQKQTTLLEECTAHGKERSKICFAQLVTWCMFRIISEPPINSPLMNICGNVGQLLHLTNMELKN